MEKVKYRVTHAFGNYSRGDIVDAILHIKGCDNEAVLLHTAEDGFDACLELAHKGMDGIYESKGYDTWMNLTEDSLNKILSK